MACIQPVKNFCCPHCSGFSASHIEGKTIFLFTNEGIGPHRELTFDSDSYCECDRCGYSGTVGDFDLHTETELPTSGLAA
jgi:hypothetical protein